VLTFVCSSAHTRSPLRHGEGRWLLGQLATEEPQVVMNELYRALKKFNMVRKQSDGVIGGFWSAAVVSSPFCLKELSIDDSQAAAQTAFALSEASPLLVLHERVSGYG